MSSPVSSPKVRLGLPLLSPLTWLSVGFAIELLTRVGEVFIPESQVPYRTLSLIGHLLILASLIVMVARGGWTSRTPLFAGLGALCMIGGSLLYNIDPGQLFPGLGQVPIFVPIVNLLRSSLTVVGLWLLIYLVGERLTTLGKERKLLRHEKSHLEEDLSKKQEIEFELRKKAAFFESVFNAVPEAFIITDLEGRIILSNQGTHRMFGYGPNELSGVPASILYADAGERLGRDENRFDPELGPFRQPEERRYRRENGSYFSGETIGSVITGPEGEKLGYLGLIRDVTDRISADLRIRESESRFRQIADHLGDVFGLFEWESLQPIYVNPAYEKIWGRPIETLLMGEELTWLDTVHPEDRKRAMEAIFKEENRERIDESFRILRPDGSLRWIRARGYPIRNEDGKIHRVAAIAQDITDLKAAQEALAASEEKYRDILDSIEEGYYEVDLKGQLTFMNPGMARILRCSPDQAKGKDYPFFYKPESLEHVYLTFNRVFKTGIPVRSSDWEFLRADGSEGFLELSISLLYDEQGNPIGFRGIARDVTERKLAEEQRRQFELQIQSTQKLESLGVLAGGIAHDFNNILVGILGNTNLAAMEVSDNQEAVGYLRQIESAAHKAAELTHKMLAYSGKGRFLVESVDARRLLSDMDHLFRVSLPESAELSYEFIDPVQPIRADVTQIRQALLSLMANASESLPEGKGSVTLRVGTFHADSEYLSTCYLDEGLPEGEYTYFEVEDTGEGMSEETRGKIFDPFFSTKFTGRGLGLAAVLGVVRAHKGAIRVESRPQKGTEIRILFPTERGETGLAGGGTKEGQQPLARTDRLLVVDDEPSVLRVTRRVLEKAGYQVETAQTGEEAIQAVRQDPTGFGLVLLDMTMPGMSGQDTLRALKEIHSGLPVVICSGYNQYDAMSRFEAGDLDGFIQKPYLPEELMETLRKWLP